MLLTRNLAQQRVPWPGAGRDAPPGPRGTTRAPARAAGSCALAQFPSGSAPDPCARRPVAAAQDCALADVALPPMLSPGTTSWMAVRQSAPTNFSMLSAAPSRQGDRSESGAHCWSAWKRGFTTKSTKAALRSGQSCSAQDLSKPGVTSRPSLLSASPCRKNSSATRRDHCTTVEGLMGPPRSAAWRASPRAKDTSSSLMSRAH
mmetsp:Transcript_19936/g.53690  ORF Transcript_19936/g.53690 Transcript_19936/m.53690 type:complete len:204 (+) Transcript_19936:107-718(+)